MTISERVCAFSVGRLKGRVLWGKKRKAKFYFLPESTFQPLMLFNPRALFPFLSFTWHANVYVSRQAKHIYKRKEVSENKKIIAITEIIFSLFVLFPTIVFDSQQVDFLPKKWLTNNCCSLFFPERKATLRNKRKLTSIKKRIMRNILGVTWHKTRMLPDLKRTILLNFLMNLRAE